jgi:transcriptional regulator with XRE-family HTH domain
MFNYNKINYLIDKKQSENKKITVAMIASGIGIHVDTLNKIKAGKSVPTFEVLEKIAIYFEVSIDSFFDNPKLNTYSIKPRLSLMAHEPVTEEYEPTRIDVNPWELLNNANTKIIKLTEELSDARLENERLKNDNAPVRDAHAG